MIKKKLSKDEFQKEIENGFEYVLLYKLSSAELLLSKEYSGIDDEVTEARFFDGSREIRLFDCDGEKKAVLIKDEENDIFDTAAELFKGRKLTVKKYISFDGDGQAYVEAKRLCHAE